jgi:XTP/dITP diphosphohydrolase
MSPVTIVIATRNRHKLGEILELLPGLELELKLLGDFPGAPEVEEDGETLAENSAKKARSAASFCGRWALADDTGLYVDALGGAPGVYSARYAGPGCSYADNNGKLLSELSGLPPEKRGARFCCALALASPSGSVITVEGRLDGRIALSASGGGGFGYDPLFLPSGKDRTLAELSPAEKNLISHRAAALRKIEPYLARLML